MNSAASSEPLLFIIDLDGTIIGNCMYQVCAHSVEGVLKKNKEKCSSIIHNSYGSSSRLVRPHFKRFYQSIKRAHPNSLFYVYTASERDWATKEISIIEKAHSIKFDRPLFTRGDCHISEDGHYRKSVKNILPRIAKKNKGAEIRDSRILVIDNNRVFDDYTDNFLLCPTYDHISFIDIWNLVRPEHLSNPNVLPTILDLQSGELMCKYNEMQSNHDRVCELKHKWLYKKHKQINNLNAKYKNDTFWKDLTHLLLTRLAPFDKRYTSYLTNVLLNKKVDVA